MACNSNRIISSGLAFPAGQFHWLLQSEYNIFTRTCTYHQIISLSNCNSSDTISQVLAAPTGKIHSGLANSGGMISLGLVLPASPFHSPLAIAME
jgi:hypothetical protein